MLEGDVFLKTGFKETNYESLATKSLLAALTTGE